MEYQITYSNKIYDNDYKKIIDSLSDFYLESLNEPSESTREGFGVYARDIHGKLIGGLVGYSELRWLYLDSMYVVAESREKSLNKKPLATIFLNAALDEAYKRKCVGVKLECFKSSVSFYKRMGFIIFYVEEYGNKNEIYYMKKIL